MTTSRARDAATTLAGQELRAWMVFTFPGITEMWPRGYTTGGGRTEQRLTGRWLDVWLTARWTPVGYRAQLAVQCRCCGRFALEVDGGPSPSFSGPTELAARVRTAPRDEVGRCFDCAWLHPAQAEAERATTRFAKARFARRHGQTVEAVLDRHHAC